MFLPNSSWNRSSIVPTKVPGVFMSSCIMTWLVKPPKGVLIVVTILLLGRGATGNDRRILK